MIQVLRQAAQDGQNAVPCRDLRNGLPIGKKHFSVIGEPVTMGSVAAAIGLARGEFVQVLSPLEETVDLLGARDRAVAGEEEAEAALDGSDVILADPLYQPVCPVGARLVPLPHLAFSGRCFQKSLPNLLNLDLEALLSQEEPA